MQVHDGLSAFHRAATAAHGEAFASAVSVGNFDGVHLGHRAILSALTTAARADGHLAVVVSFEPHPRNVLSPSAAPVPTITPRSHKAELLAACGVSDWVIVRSEPAFFALSAEQFIDDVLRDALHTHALVEGGDFRFGQQRRGDLAMVEADFSRDGRRVVRVPPVTVELDGQPTRVSSTAVRQAIIDGDLTTARAMLTRNHRLVGTIVRGAQRGRTIGFPTANLDTGEQLRPGGGVYAGTALLHDGASHPAAIHVGPAVTFGDARPTVEVHVLDDPPALAGEAYGQSMDVELVARVRGTIAFAGPDALIRQLQQDVAAVRTMLPTGRP